MGKPGSQESISCVTVGNNDVARRGISCLLLTLLSCAGVRLSVLSLARWRNFSTTLRALLFAVSVSSLLEISVRSVCDSVSVPITSPGYSAHASYNCSWLVDNIEVRYFFEILRFIPYKIFLMFIELVFGKEQISLYRNKEMYILLIKTNQLTLLVKVVYAHNNIV